jgi:Domain of unknown function (DUF4440)
MQKIFINRQFLFLVVAFFISTQSPKAQTADSGLYQEIARQDSILFTAFNTRDIEQFKKMFTKDLEFFHDIGGLTTYDYTINSLVETAKRNDGLRRDIVNGTLEVYPIPGYGAMQIGEHRFCHTENNKQDCGTFKFVHIWQKKDGVWKITRVVSYGH